MAGHILLAEDDKALSALMQDFFRAAGVAVTPAYDGEQALVLAQAQPFDLLVLDVMMPHLNGLEVCEAVRQESDVPVIFVTALGQEGDTLAGFRAGTDFDGDERMIDRHIASLRKALGTASQHIRAVYGKGYRLGGST